MSEGGWGKDPERERYLALQEQARVHLGRRARVTLEDSAKFYAEKAEDRSLPKTERDLWQQLLDEVETRLGRRAPPSRQEELLSVLLVPKEMQWPDVPPEQPAP